MGRNLAMLAGVMLSVWACSDDDAPGGAEARGGTAGANPSGGTTAGVAQMGEAGARPVGSAGRTSQGGAPPSGNAGEGAGGEVAVGGFTSSGGQAGETSATGGMGGDGGADVTTMAGAGGASSTTDGGAGGMGGADSTPPAGMCRVGNLERAIKTPVAGGLLITEVLANPANVMDGTTDAQKEWFELQNIGASAFDLNELILKSPGTAGAAIISADCISISPGSFALLARSSESKKNGGLPSPDATFAFSLVDSGANAGVSVLDGLTVLDAVSWPSVASGLSTALDPDASDTSANDVLAVTAGVSCRGATGYGDLTNKGTPRAANEQCP